LLKISDFSLHLGELLTLLRKKCRVTLCRHN
jgi:hypothetical protein